MTENNFFSATKIKDRSYTMSPNHYHSHYELLYVTTGTFRYFIDKTSLSVSANNVILVKKNSIHKAILNDSPCTYYLIYFSKNMINTEHWEILDQLFDKYQLILQQDFFYIDLLFSKICREYEKMPPFWEHSLYYQLNELIISLYRFTLTHNVSVKKSYSPVEQSAKFINDCIEKQEASLISLEYISNQYHLSPSNFSKKFKKETGINFKQYVIISQILYAQKLIDTTSLPITEIAFRCGFTDSNYFSTVFKRVTKISPREYAALTRKRND